MIKSRALALAFRSCPPTKETLKWVMANLTLFCGASFGNDPALVEDCRDLGLLLAQRGFDLVYGGGTMGLMGLMANLFLEHHKKVIGIIPRAMNSTEVQHTKLTQTIEVKDLFERKRKMIEMGDKFLVLPGGFGTLDELFEVVTLNQLNLIHKPVVVYNRNRFYDSLQDHINHCTEANFLSAKNASIMSFISDKIEICNFLA